MCREVCRNIDEGKGESVMNDVHIKTFLTVAETLSFTKAANQLFLTQQAVSKYIGEMETQLNLVLFERNRTTVRLTPEGKILQGLFKEVIREYQVTTDKVKNYYQQLTFQFKIGVSEEIDPYGVIWDGISAFISHHGDTVVHGTQFKLDRMRNMLEQGEMDVALAFDSDVLLSDEYEVRTIVKEPLYLYAPEEFCQNTLDRNCWGLPLLYQASWDWGYLEWNKIGPQRLARLNLHPNRYLGVSNEASLAAEMELHCFTTVADARFGIVHKIPGLKGFSLSQESALYCIWNRENDHPLIPQFVDDMYDFFSQA